MEEFLSTLLDNGFKSNPFDKIPELQQKLEEFVASLPETVDTTSVTQKRENLGIPNWSIEEQIDMVIDMILRIFPESKDGMADREVIRANIAGLISFYTREDIKKEMPKNDKVAIKIYAVGKKDRHCNFNICQWEAFLRLVIPYYIACTKISDELKVKIERLLSEDEFDWHGGATTGTFDPETGRDRVKSIKLHHASLLQAEKDPLFYAIDEYRIGMHEIVHSLDDYDIIPKNAKSPEYMNEAVVYLILLENGIRIEGVLENLQDVKTRDPYRAGRAAAFRAFKKGEKSTKYLADLFRKRKRSYEQKMREIYGEYVGD